MNQREKFIEWKNTISGEKVPEHGFEMLQDDCMFHAWKAAIASQQQRISELERLSVTNILLKIVPGNGDGFEVYAKSVDDVEKMLTDLSCGLEDVEYERDSLKAANKDSQNHFDALKANYDATQLRLAQIYKIIAQRDKQSTSAFAALLNG